MVSEGAEREGRRRKSYFWRETGAVFGMKLILVRERPFGVYSNYSLHFICVKTLASVPVRTGTTVLYWCTYYTVQ